MRLRRLHPAALAAAAVLAALAAGGCGLGPGGAAGGTHLVVSEDFGAHTLLDTESPKTGGSDTVMRFLQRNARVSTRYGGGFVQAIDGRAGGQEHGRPVDWFFYVNGVLSQKGAASVRLRNGDTVWWDRHDWGASPGPPAVVGSFPEPFAHGIDGRRLPLRVECSQPSSAACKVTLKKFNDQGILAAPGILGGSFTNETLRVVVGPYAQLREDETVRQLEKGPSVSGVYARMSKDGRRIAVLDPKGRTARVLQAGSGLVAATRFEDGRPVWIITGTDEQGVASAAGALDQATLKDRFALAVSNDQGVAVPLVAGAP